MKEALGLVRNIARTHAAVLCALASVLAVADRGVAQGAAQAELQDWQPRVEASPAGQKSPRRAAHAGQRKGSGIRVTDAALSEEGGETRFVLSLSGSVGAKVFTLANPHRVVVDLPEIAFALPETAGRQGGGLVSSFRYGLIEAGQSRVVLDLARPARVEAADMAHLPGQRATRLTMRLAPTDEASFLREATVPLPAVADQAGVAAGAADDGVRRGKATAQRTKPVVVIDPGHGGIDPGAVGTTNITEKSITLAVAKQVADILGTSRRTNVVLTRNDDKFVSLDARLALSRRHAADLFISIHADAIDARFAQSVRGASIYTLAERASDERARLLAEKENAADALAGVATLPDDDRDQVKGILIDLLQRETASFSTEFSGLLVGRLSQALSLAREPQRGGAFKVLKQTQSPSVLIELGYMSNAEDEQQMRSIEWQRKVAQAIAAAVEAYFAKRTAGSP